MLHLSNIIGNIINLYPNQIKYKIQSYKIINYDDELKRTITVSVSFFLLYTASVTNGIIYNI